MPITSVLLLLLRTGVGGTADDNDVLYLTYASNLLMEAIHTHSKSHCQTITLYFYFALESPLQWTTVVLCYLVGS